MPKRSSTACGTCKPPVTPGQTTERDFETLAMRPDAGRQSLCAPLEKVITQAVSHARRVTDETLGCTTKPECARPRAQQRENAKRPWKTSPCRCHLALLRPGTGALRCRLSRGPGSNGAKRLLPGPGCDGRTSRGRWREAAAGGGPNKHANSLNGPVSAPAERQQNIWFCGSRLRPNHCAVIGGIRSESGSRPADAQGESTERQRSE